MPSDAAKRLLRELRARGFTVTPTRGGHYKVVREDMTGPVYTARSPGDYRSYRNALAEIRRSLKTTGATRR